MSTLAIRGRINATSPVILAGLCFLIFAPIEIAVSFIVHNSAIAGNAFHDAFDGIYFIAFGFIDGKMARSPYHEVFCTRRGKFGIVTASLAIVFVAIGLVFERSNDTSAQQMVAGFIVGPISLGLNFFWERKLDKSDDHKHSGFTVHLFGDMAGSAVATVSGVGAYLFASGRWNFWGGILILVITFGIALAKSRSIWRDIRHNADEHHLIHNHALDSH